MTSILLEAAIKGLKKRPITPEKKYVRIIYQDVNGEYFLNDKQIVVDNNDAISQQILNVLTTVPGDRPFEPLFGSRLPFLLFDLMVQNTAIEIKNESIGALNRFMPHITIDNNLSEVIAFPNEGAWVVKIYYSINGSDFKNTTFRFAV